MRSLGASEQREPKTPPSNTQKRTCHRPPPPVSRHDFDVDADLGATVRTIKPHALIHDPAKEAETYMKKVLPNVDEDTKTAETAEGASDRDSPCTTVTIPITPPHDGGATTQNTEILFPEPPSLRVPDLTKSCILRYTFLDNTPASPRDSMYLRFSFHQPRSPSPVNDSEPTERVRASKVKERAGARVKERAGARVKERAGARLRAKTKETKKKKATHEKNEAKRQVRKPRVKQWKSRTRQKPAVATPARKRPRADPDRTPKRVKVDAGCPAWGEDEDGDEDEDEPLSSLLVGTGTFDSVEYGITYSWSQLSWNVLDAIVEPGPLPIPA